MTSKNQSLPVGSIVSYAGNLDNAELIKIGWHICDGTEMEVLAHSDLHDVIRNINGGDGKHFNLPNYQGRFMRCVDPTGKVDKGASDRTSPAAGGATGRCVGSVESFSTARPHLNFEAAVPHMPNDFCYTDSGADSKTYHLYRKGKATYSSSGGGDVETRPRNAYVNFIIQTEVSAPLPGGTVVPFAGKQTESAKVFGGQYSYCNGTKVKKNHKLFTHIGYTHGRSSSAFFLPDYRGRFLRGVHNGAGHDPEASSREAMAPGGTSGDAVGSIQDYS